MKKFFLSTYEEVVQYLHSSMHSGLTEAKVQEHANKYGKNTFTERKKKPLILRILLALKEPMLVLLLIAWAITIVVNIIQWIQIRHFDFAECFGILAAIFISVALTIIMEGRSEKAFAALNKIKNGVMCKVLREGSVQNIPQEEIVVGDILYVNMGDKIVADGRLLSSTDLQCDESALTGESMSVNKDANAIITEEDTPLSAHVNFCYTGTFVTHGNGMMIVTAVGDNTEFGKIAQEIQLVDGEQTPLQKKLAKLGRNITLFGGIFAAIIFIIQFVHLFVTKNVQFQSVSSIFITSIVLLVASVPEGLPTIVAISLSIHVAKMATKQILVKKLVACEIVGGINMICSDKTGTLTENKMTVTDIWANGCYHPLDKLCSQEMLLNFAINSTADLKIEGEHITLLGNATEAALLVYLHKNKVNYRELRQNTNLIKSYSFSSVHKNMTVCIEKEDGYLIFSKGSPEKIAQLCQLTAVEREQIENAQIMNQREAKRVLAFAHKYVKTLPSTREEFERDLQYDGFVAIQDKLRPEVFSAMKTCQNAGIQVKILTGDNIVTATEIAKQLSLLDNGQQAMEARKLEGLSDEVFANILPQVAVIARSTPHLKMRVVDSLKKKGNVVAVTGDGINDAPALKASDIGIAMGRVGTEVAKEAADLVLLNDSFAAIVTSIQWGRAIYDNFKRFIQFQLTVNLASVLFIFLYTLVSLWIPDIQQPFSALDLLWINIIMDGPPALTLGLEPMHENLLTRNPPKRNESIVTSAMLQKIIISGMYMAIICFLQLVFNFAQIAPEKNSTFIFTLFVLMQLWNAFTCRELGYKSIFKNFFQNKWMLLTFSVTLILQIIITQFGGHVFGTIALNAIDWLKTIAISISILFLQELVKFCLQKIMQKQEGRKSGEVYLQR